MSIITNINFAIVGCGRIAQRHAEHIENTDQCKLVACCDIVPERASSLAQSIMQNLILRLKIYWKMKI